MEALFSGLSNAIEGAPLIASGAALLWGVLSILLSPCHLSSIPLIVGFINGQGRISTRRAFVIALLFALGILITIACVGTITALAGRMLGHVGRGVNYLVAIIFFVVGLHLMGVFTLPFRGSGPVHTARRGLIAAFVLGLVFGIALGPCTFAFMAPMLAVTFQLASTRLVYAIWLLVLYGIGHCSVIVLAGTFTEVVQRYLDWNAQSRRAELLRRACGLLVLLAGLYMLYRA